MNKYKPKEFAEMLHVTVRTLQKWDVVGKLKAFRTPTNRRFYTEEQYLAYFLPHLRPAKIQEQAEGR